MVQKTASDNIANLLDGSLGVNVAQVDGAIAQVVHTTSSSCDGSGSHGLLGQSVRDEITVGIVQYVCVTRGDTKVLSSVLLLCLGNICATILTVVNTTRGLPLGLLGKLGNSLDGISNRQEVNESNSLLSNNLDGVDGTILGQILSELVFRNFLRQVTKIDVAGRARLLDGKSD